MVRLSERFVIPFVIKPADNAGGVTGDSVHMGKAHHIMFKLSFGSVTGDAVLTLKSGATEGAETTSETFNYRLADADQGSANADQYADWSTSSSLTLTAATYDNRLLLIEMDSDELTDGQPWLTLALSSAASTLFTACTAVAQGRTEANDPLTIIK